MEVKIYDYSAEDGNKAVKLLRYPTEEDWAGCKQRALITVGKGLILPEPPPSAWREKILRARHSPIRYLNYSFLFVGIPSNTATHFARHTHAVPYIQSLRNDRQNRIDGDNAPRNTPVNMIWDLNAEELMTVANKRLCNLAAGKTQEVVKEMCRLAAEVTPELKNLLVPACEYNGVCHEMRPCGRKL